MEFEEEPVGTASLAQVHRARLKDGSRVAVKIQHPRVKAHSFVDMKTMEVRFKANSLKIEHESDFTSKVFNNNVLYYSDQFRLKMGKKPKFKAKSLSSSVPRSLTAANSNDKAISLFTYVAP